MCGVTKNDRIRNKHVIESGITGGERDENAVMDVWSHVGR